MPESNLPTHIDWYRDATKWLVTTSGAAIVLGYGFVSTGDADQVSRWAFALSSVVLLVSIFAGILCHFWLLSYANEFENREALLAAHKPAPLTHVNRARAWVAFFYHPMMWAFFIGMALFTTFCAYRIFVPPAASSSPMLVAGPASDIPFALVDGSRKVVWLLKPGKNGYVWEKAPDLP
jgi:hypothetical protein